MSELRIVMVEDVEDDALLLVRMLRRDGCALTFRRVETAEAFGAALDEASWDAVLCDWSLPRFSALAALDMVRAHALDLPFIIVSGTIGEEAAVAAMKAGAHDYIPKSNLARLLPAIERERREAARRATACQTEQRLQESQRQLALLFSNIPGMAYRCRNDHSWTLEFVSEGAYDLTGYLPADLTKHQRNVYADLIHPDDRDRVWETVQVAVQADAPYQVTYRIRTAGGSQKWVMEQGCAVLDEGGTVRFLEGIVTDMSEQRETQLALQEREALFRQLFEHSPDAILLLDPDDASGMWPIVDCNAAACRMNGYTRSELLGQSLNLLNVAPATREDWTAALKRLEQESALQDESWHRRKDGTLVPIEFRTALITVGDRRLVLGIDRDITERKQAEAQLLHDALHDALTGLPNRTLFRDRLAHALERDVRTPDRHCAVLFLDLDEFKTINDSLGHLQGDTLLQEVACRLSGCIRPGDTIARLGGDEFAILLEEIPALNYATSVAERIQQALVAPLQLGEHTIAMTASIGITMSGPGNVRPEDLLRDADIAMYRAKHLGKARYEVFDPTMLDEIQTRLRVEAELRQAIERDELVLHYQPIVDVTSGNVEGVEALVRWQHPVRGLVPPNVFIPIAEQTGLIVPLGQWVLRTACAQAARWRAAGWAWYVSVNLAALQLRQDDLPRMLSQTLKDTGLAPAGLQFELTESNAMVNPARTAAVLAEARALGLHGVAIDDFGTGYSSLSYLQQFPVTCVKIDRSFVRELATSASNAALVRAIIAMAHSLQLKVVAEGVETAAQLAFLRAHGCDGAQGYLFSAPLAADALEQLLAATQLPPGSTTRLE